jgi:hypothetical protein
MVGAKCKETQEQDSTDSFCPTMIVSQSAATPTPMRGFTAGLKYSFNISFDMQNKTSTRKFAPLASKYQQYQDTLLRISLQNVQRSLSCILPEEETREQSTSEEFLVNIGTKHVKEGRPRTRVCGLNLMLLSPLSFRGKKKHEF